jgi:ubiquinone/menaquinone biosynthesis C-methylase UbiE
MNHADHVYLLQAGIPAPGGVWADLGAGTGAFTLALADLIGPSGQLIAVDRDLAALQQQAAMMQKRFHAVPIRYQNADFTQPLDLPILDGIVLANSLHFVPYADQIALLTRLKGYLQPTGRLLLVEYDSDQGNPWVPYPRRYERWAEIALESGFGQVSLLQHVPSRYLGAMFSTLALVAKD